MQLYPFLFTLAQYTEKGKGLLGSGIELGGLFNSVKIDADSYKDTIEKFKGLNFKSSVPKLDDGSTDWDAIAQSIKGCDDKVLAYFKTLEDGNGNINNAAASTQGLADHLRSAGLSAGFAAIKTALLNTALNAGIGLIVALVGQGLTALIQHQEKIRQSAEDAANTYQESSLALNDQVAKYRELKAALEEASGDEEAAYNIKKQLYELQQNLTATYGDQAKGLDLVNGSLETQLALMGNLSKAEAHKVMTGHGTGSSQRIRLPYRNVYQQLYRMVGYSREKPRTKPAGVLKEWQRNELDVDVPAQMKLPVSKPSVYVKNLALTCRHIFEYAYHVLFRKMASLSV